MRILLVLVAVIGASCAGGGSPGVLTDKVRIFDDPAKPEAQWGYDPKEIRVASGTSVTFTNSGMVFHTVTSDGATRTFDVAVNPGASATVTFERAGTFAYHCGVHPDMKGVVHVCDGECR